MYAQRPSHLRADYRLIADLPVGAKHRAELRERWTAHNSDGLYATVSGHEKHESPIDEKACGHGSQHVRA